MSHKGFVAARTVVDPTLEIDVYNLHAQAGDDEYRLKQFGQLLEAMQSFSFGGGRPVLAIGDFNCEVGKKECDWLIEKAGLIHVDPDPEGIDHIFYNENNSGWDIEVMDYGVAFDEPVNGKKLSDHDAFEATLRFKKQ